MRHTRVLTNAPFRLECDIYATKTPGKFKLGLRLVRILCGCGFPRKSDNGSFHADGASCSTGLMLGRLLLLWLNKKVIFRQTFAPPITLADNLHRSANAAPSSSTYSLPSSLSSPPPLVPHDTRLLEHTISGRLEVTVWVVPSLIENAVAVALVGMILGPVYPILMNHTTKILPRWLLTASIGYIAGMGQAGSAVLPFLTGVLA